MIHVVSVGRNTAAFAERHLASLTSQRDAEFRATVIDDHSDDGTWERYSECRDERLTFVRNAHPTPKLTTLRRFVETSKADEIIVLVDADDFLAHDRALYAIADAFTDPDVWLTYGGMVTTDGHELVGGAYPEDVVRENRFRSAPWHFAHPRCFRQWLWRLIPESHVVDDDGQPWAVAIDQAFGLALLELAGTHSRRLFEHHYAYNARNPAANHHVRLAEQTAACMRVRNRKPLRPFDAVVDSLLEKWTVKTATHEELDALFETTKEVP